MCRRVAPDGRRHEIQGPLRLHIILSISLNNLEGALSLINTAWHSNRLANVRWAGATAFLTKIEDVYFGWSSFARRKKEEGRKRICNLETSSKIAILR